MKHNNELPNNHFRKTAIRFKTWFDQPAKKLKRRAERKKKEKACYPMPLNKLRPIVRCPTIRHNKKERLGRGFTPEECMAAGLEYTYARKIGISVDLRRKNRNVEAFNQNVERLQSYKSKLTFYDSKKEAVNSKAKQIKGKIMPLVKKIPVVEAVKVEEIAKIN
ncbi:60S ribosomal L13-like [Tubulinosema ratisbonensis]|uniref:60S ribosomal L13-like n=1 Tax=Tubulinosema ratisbonensis TaxID=291195 RepID=A0A437AQF3_9MICR|nr:60S ribosomal L13-like [Tubulinosema ratisbonensis]